MEDERPANIMRAVRSPLIVTGCRNVVRDIGLPSADRRSIRSVLK
jgi:hypothetical protein